MLYLLLGLEVGIFEGMMEGGERKGRESLQNSGIFWLGWRILTTTEMVYGCIEEVRSVLSFRLVGEIIDRRGVEPFYAVAEWNCNGPIFAIPAKWHLSR